VTGHLWFNGAEVDTVDTTFKVTVTEAAATTATTADDTSASTSASPESACSNIGYKTSTEKEGFPQFTLTEVVDPSTGQSVKYTVSIPTKIKAIFAYEESDLLIYSTVDTSKVGSSGLYTITVKATCNGVEKEV
jgi:hypothetical protein